MPIEYKPYRIDGEVAEIGPEISIVNRGGCEERYGVRVQNVLSEQNKNVFRGRVTLENSEETSQLKKGVGADKFVIQVDNQYNINLTKKRMVTEI